MARGFEKQLNRRKSRKNFRSRVQLESLEQRMLLAYGAIVLADSPLAYYQFEEAAGPTAVDSSTSATNGTYVGGVTLSQPSTNAGLGNAVGFDGTSGAVNTPVSMSNAGAFSLEAWVRPTVAEPNRTGIVGQNDVLEFGFINATTIELWDPAFGALQVTYDSGANAGQWFHLVATGTGTEKSIYINGQLAGTQAHAAGTYGASGFNINIGGGGIQDASGNFFQGDIDEVAIYSTALTAAQVAAHYAATFGPTVLGTGAGALLGNDLTDLNNDGNEGAYNPPDLAGFDATFFSSDESGFGGGEFAFNVFDNLVGGGNDKWCCGSAFPQIVGAQLPSPYKLTHFTVASANDTPGRDPRVWHIEGSNDGNTWTTIFTQDDPNETLWTERNQVLRFDADVSFPVQDAAYSYFRMRIDQTGLTAGAFFQLAEIEFFGLSATPTVLGTGTAALLGNDLTDLNNDGNEGAYNPPADLGGFDATFFSSDEPGFGGGEFAFNVFDNLVGGGNDKWCCGTAFPQIVGAELPRPYLLTHFTVASANDTEGRDPRVWHIEGSNDGNNWTTVFSQNDPNGALWTARNQVLRFDAGVNFPVQDTAYSYFRMRTDQTGLTAGAFFQLAEIEFFGIRPPVEGIVWDGDAGDGDWNNPVNWSGDDNIPDQPDEFANFADAAVGTVSLNGASYSIGGINFVGSGGGFNITDGRLSLQSIEQSGAGINEVSADISARIVQAGLLVGQIAENNNTTTPNPGDLGVMLDILYGQTNAKPPWEDNHTYVYTGQMYDADGVFSLAEHIDDNVWISIDGNVVLNNTEWNVPTSTGVLDLGLGPAGDGWHDVEFRLSHGGGGAGAVGGGGWSTTFGFGYNIDGSAGSDGANDGYIAPVDPGDGSLFRVVRDSETLSVNNFTAGSELVLSGDVDIDGVALSVEGEGDVSITGDISGGFEITPGLLVGQIAENNNTTTPNPGDLGVMLDILYGQTNAKPPWEDNHTYIYTGQMFDADGVFSLAEHIDDNVWISIDGNVVLNNTEWNVPTTTGILNTGMGPNGDGWHDVEFRLSHGGGGAGAVGGGGWTTTFGFGYNIDGSAGSDGANDGYVAPVDPGDASLFRVLGSGGTINKTGAGTLTLAGNNSYEGATTVEGGFLRIMNDSALGSADAGTTVEDGATLELGGSTNLSGETLSVVGSGVGGVGAIINSGDDSTLDTTILFDGELVVGSVTPGAALIIANDVDLNDPRSLTVTGAGDVNLTGSLLGTDVSTPGLLVGQIAENNNTTTPNPGDFGLMFDILYGQTNAKPPWEDNHTYIYTGQMFDADGVFSLAEHIDDNVWISIDGNVVLNNTEWNVPTTTGILNVGMGARGDGWHDVEFRLSHGGGGAGAVGGGGWTTEFGFGYNIDGSAGSDGANDGYIAPVDPGDGSLFRYAELAGDVTKTGAGTLRLIGDNSTYDGVMRIQQGTVEATSGNSLGSSAGGTVIEDGGALELAGTFDLVSEAITASGDGVGGLGAIVNSGGDSALGGALNLGGSLTLGSETAGATLTLNVDMDLTGRSLTFAGDGDFDARGSLSGADAILPGQLTASVYINGDTSDNALLNIGDGTGTGGLLGQTPVQTKTITQAINFQNDGQFRAFFEGLQQDDNYQTMFEGFVQIPDRNGDGTAYDVEFGTRRADDPVVIYVDLNQDGVFSNADGEQILYRPCCGDGYVAVNIAPGTYGYMATHAERGGGSQIEPTIDLFDGNGRRTVEPGAMPDLFQSGALVGDVTKTGAGTLRLSGDNSTFAGRVEILGGTLVATNDTSLGTSSKGTSLDGGILELNGGVNVVDEELSTSGDASAIRSVAGDSTVGDITMDSDLTIWSEGGLLVVSGDINMGFSNLSFDGSGDTRVDGTISDSGILPRIPETGGALLASVYINGDTSDNAVFNIGVPGADSLLTKTPIQSLPITQRIDFRDDGQFRSFFTGLQQDDNYQTTFEGIVNIPDVNGDGSAVNVEFGSNRGDDPVAIFVDLNQNGVFESSQGENVAQRGCCGSVYATVSLEPGAYRYLAAHAERGGGSQIEPTINLGPPLSIDIPGQSISPVFQSWSTAPTSVISEAVRYGDGAGGNLNGCAPFAPDSLAGDVVLVDRGACTFTSKIFNIANGGGVAGIIGLIDASAPFDGGFADPGGPITIPGYMISQVDANAIRDALPTTATINPGRQTINPGAMGDLFIIQEGREPVRVMGTGTVIFAGDNTYHVDTIVENGALLVDNAGDPIVIADIPDFSLTIGEDPLPPFTFDGNPNDLDSWSVSSGTAGAQAGQDGQVTSGMTGQFGSFAHDAAHETYRLTSPVFTLNGSGDLTFVMRGGDTNGRSAPANLASVPANSLDQGDARAFQGLILRDITTDDIVLSGNPASESGNLNTGTFTAAQLADLEANNPGAQYVAEFLDFFHGGWGWVNLDSVSIPGDPVLDAPDATLFGNAVLNGPVARLTQAADLQEGAVWLDGTPHLAAGFDATFEFSMPNAANGGGDGMSFNVHPTGGVNIDQRGPASDNLTISLDSVLNTISVISAGTVIAEADLSPIELSGIGQTPVSISYRPGDLDVTFNGFDVLSDVDVNLVDLGAVDSTGNGAIGFGAGTGGAVDDVLVSVIDLADFTVASSLDLVGSANVVNGNVLQLTAAANSQQGSAWYNGGPDTLPIQIQSRAATVTQITPRVDFGDGTEAAPGDGSVLDRGGSGGNPLGGIGVDVGVDQIGAVWSGQIEIPEDGDYRFTTRSDDGSVLFIDGMQVVNNNFFQGMTNRSGDVNLTAGRHDILIAGYEGGGGAGWQASWERLGGFAREIISPDVLYNDVATPGTFVSGGLRGEYIQNVGAAEALLDSVSALPILIQSRAATVTQITPSVDFGDGTEAAPGDGSVLDRGGSGGNPLGGIGVDVGVDQIGAVWSGQIEIPEDASYIFTTRSDDGSVLFIDGLQVVDNNFFQGMTNRSGTVSLPAGRHDILIAGYEGGGGAGWQASWEQVGGNNPFGREIIPSTVLFNDVDSPGTFVVGGLKGEYIANVGATEALLRPTFSKEKVDVSQGFETSFTFSFDNPNNNGADGMSFNVHNDPGGTTLNVGERGPGSNNLTVSFDSWDNGAPELASISKIVLWNANTVLGQVDLLPLDLSGIGPTEAIISYRPGDLDVTVAGMPIFTDFPIDLGTLGAMDADGMSYIGFGGRTGGANEEHNLYNWTFERVGERPVDVPVEAHVLHSVMVSVPASGTGSGDVFVQAGGTLAGNGTITGSVTVQADGTLTGGSVPGMAGTLSTGSVLMEPGSIGLAEITSNGADQANVTGTVTLNDPIGFPVLENGYRPADGEVFVIFNNNGADPIHGTFAGFPEGAQFELDNGDSNRLFEISYVGGDGNDLTFTHINRAPVFDAGGPYTIGEGDSLTLDASGSVDDDLDLLSYSWDVNGDGVFGDATGVNPTLSWAELNALGIDDGPASFDVTVKGDDGEASGDASTTLTLDNTAPTAEITGADSGVPNLPLAFTLRALGEPAQPDRDAGYTYVVDWGDGSVDTIGPGAGDTINLQHAFSSVGLFDVTLTVSDKDGGSTTDVLPVDIAPVAQVGDTLYVGGTDDKNDRIEVRAAGLEQIDVRYNDIRYGRFQPARVVIYGGDGKDRITVNATLPAEVYGEEGADYIALSSANDIVYGGPGRDTILVGSGDNWVDGGEGNDTIFAREGADELHGGAGNDRVDGGSGDDLLYGDAGNDQLIAGNGNDLLVGGAGNDAIFGQGGIDVIIGGDGNDKNRGGSGDDLIIGGFGNDGLQGERGDDTLNSGDAQLADDSDAQLALLAEWVSSRSYNSIGSFFDDGDKDGMDGGGGPDEIYFGSNDSLSLVRDNDSLFLL